jgi:hypothetical protein
MYICLKYCAAWAHNIGYGLALASILQIPFWFLVQIILKVQAQKNYNPTLVLDLDLLEYFNAFFFQYKGCLSFIEDNKKISPSLKVIF